MFVKMMKAASAVGFGLIALFYFGVCNPDESQVVLEKAGDAVSSVIPRDVQDEFSRKVAEKRIDRVEKKVAEVTKSISKHDFKIDASVEELKKSDAAKKHAQNRLERMQKICAESDLTQQEFDQAQSELQELRSFYEVSVRNDNLLKERIAKLKSNRADLHAGCRDLVSKIDQARNKLSEKSTEIALNNATRLLKSTEKMIAIIGIEPDDDVETTLAAFRGSSSAEVSSSAELLEKANELAELLRQ